MVHESLQSLILNQLSTLWFRVYGQRVADMVTPVLRPKTDISGIVAALMGRLATVEVTMLYPNDGLALNFDHVKINSANN